MGTQWRVGMNGPTGLDYNVLFRLMDEAKIVGEEWHDTLADVRVLESAALTSMRE